MTVATVISTQLEAAVPLSEVTSLQDRVQGRTPEELESWLEQESIRVHQYYLSIQTFRNSLRPIHRLPNELLEFIIAQGYEEPTCSVYLSHVCQRWRMLALGIPDLWTYIDVERMDRTIENLRRSKGRPLSIDWGPRLSFEGQPRTLGYKAGIAFQWKQVPFRGLRVLKIALQNMNSLLDIDHLLAELPLCPELQELVLRSAAADPLIVPATTGTETLAHLPRLHLLDLNLHAAATKYLLRRIVVPDDTTIRLSCDCLSLLATYPTIDILPQGLNNLLPFRRVSRINLGYTMRKPAIILEGYADQSDIPETAIEPLIRVTFAIPARFAHMGKRELRNSFNLAQFLRLLTNIVHSDSIRHLSISCLMRAGERLNNTATALPREDVSVQDIEFRQAVRCFARYKVSLRHGRVGGEEFRRRIRGGGKFF
ncbi:hypothetical protein K474DRAFT_1735251 [Panus rudis PR-1116 ss-1]|nr:hypothetical protein K474DRAFT_1735251 [Panus rudis PR-1116 ss-1]